MNDTLNAFDFGETRTPTLILENHPNDSRVKIREDGVFQTLSSRMGTGGGNVPMVMENNMETVVRRLTPLECERLQGFPDGWTDIGEWTDSKGKLHKNADSPRYKALGNSIALPFWQWMAERIVKQFKHKPTMGSLFDGIGGFPLVFKRCGCEPVWASEIEEFPIAVTTRHFGEDGDIDKYIESETPINTRGGQTFCIGNGQVNDAVTPSVEVSKTLNCMDDPMKIMEKNNETHTNRPISNASVAVKTQDNDDQAEDKGLV